MRDFVIRVFLVAFIHSSNIYFVQAQESSPDLGQRLSLGLTGYYGFIDPNLADLAYVLDSRPWLLELSVSAQTTGNKSWQQLNGYPELGVALLYGNSGSQEYIGHVTALVPYIQFPLFRSSRFYGNFRVGMGAAWVEKIFNPQTDYKNLIIGSHLNFCANLMASAGMQVLPRTKLNIGLSLTHISNGSMKLPNYGLNPVSISAGITYDLHPQLKMIRTPIPTLEKKWDFFIYVLAAFKESYPLESPVYLVNIVNLEAMKDFSHTGRFGGGINLTYDRALSKEEFNTPTYAFDGSKLKLEVALYLAYEYVAGDLSFPVQLGCYVFDQYPVSAFYETVGIKYRISKHWNVGGAVKAYLGHGDFIQWGFGYKF
jgi:hypothetical protein